MAERNTPPSITKTAFDCPHCGAFTTQYWYQVYAKFNGDRNNEVPFLPNEQDMQSLFSNKELSPEQKMHFKIEYDKLISGLVFFASIKGYTNADKLVNNIFISKCYNCDKIALWVHDKLLYPPERYGEPPNSELPQDVLLDYEEARTILNLSPRGASALLRLCVAKLCIFLGEKGKNLNDDIASLVKKGLPDQIQQALDIVRVIGNYAVHPGQIDLKDDRDTATHLFNLVNLIAEEMIARPKRIAKLYKSLPEGKRSQGDSPVEMQCRSPLFLADAPHILCYRSAHAT